MTYLVIKTLHILSAIILFGTGLGSAFYKLSADKSRNTTHIAITNRQVVFADWIFTTPTILIQPLTGFILLYLSHISFTTPWLMISLILYVIAGLCWLPVVILQLKMRKLSNQALSQNECLPSQYWRYQQQWFWLGIPAFICMISIVFLMVIKPNIIF